MSRRLPCHHAPALLAPLLALALRPGVAAAGEFTYEPPGDLLPGSGDGRDDEVIYAPGMRFPIESGPAFANSQVYNRGGVSGPRGGQCDTPNYAYPWRDNYCETRSWDMPLCPAGSGHQGQDIRPATCEAGKHWAVAAVSGTITSIGGYSVYLTGDDGTRYDYLHMSDVQVTPGQTVTRGQRLGKVSNVFGSTPTTIHLHFNIRQFVGGVGNVYVPPYASLVASYRALLNAPPEGALEAVSCGGIKGWTRDPDGGDAPSTVRLYFDGAALEQGVDGYTFPAATRRDDLCASLGSCDHGFEVPLPLSLLGDGEHRVHAHGRDAESGDEVELTGSPKTFSCPLELPDGVRRPLEGSSSLDSWRLSTFWDVASAAEAALAALPEGEAFPQAPRLARGGDGAPEIWLLDGGERRPIGSAEVAAAWALDLGAAETWPADELEALPEGPALPRRPFLVRGAGPTAYVIDARKPVVSRADAAGAGGDSAAPPREASGLEGQVRCAYGAGGANSGLPPGLLALALTALRRGSGRRPRTPR